VSDWRAAGIGYLLLRDIALGALAFIAVAGLFVLFGWPLLAYVWHYWMG
jgi:hypothetical protein